MSANGSEAGTLELRGVVAGYYSGRPVLNDVTLRALPHRVTVVLGPNGAGKSTALRVLAGIIKPARGAVLLDGADISATPAHRMIELGVGFLPQGRSTFPALSVHENLELGGWSLRRRGNHRAAAVEAMYERYPLLAEVRQKPAGSLSGGQQRILEIARMMISDPRIVLVDEPSAGLAPIVADQVYEEIAALKEEGRTILLVDQNVRAAVALADYVYTLESGRNQLDGDRDAFESDLGAVIKGWLRLS